MPNVDTIATDTKFIFAPATRFDPDQTACLAQRIIDFPNNQVPPFKRMKIMSIAYCRRTSGLLATAALACAAVFSWVLN